MKKIFIFSLILGSTFFLSTSCEKLSVPQEESAAKEAQNVKVITRSVTNDITYPLVVYAFNSSGDLAAQQTLGSSAESISFSLPSGTYHLVALSGTDGYAVPSSPSYSSLVQMSSETNSSSSALQTGQAEITVGNSSQSVNITLGYKVATVSMTLSGLPSSVTSVSVIVSQQYSAIKFDGEYSGAKSTAFQLIKSGDDWTGNTYLFPGSSSQTVFSISVTDADSVTSYGYTYSHPLAAATPYKLTGTYSTGNLSVSASFINEGWNTPINLVFDFGPNNSGGEVTPVEDVSDFPAAGTIWKDHLVAYVYDDSGNILSASETKDCASVNLLLLSLAEWTKVCSAMNATNPAEAADYASAYTEDELSGWTIPTEAEVMNLITLYNVSNEETMDALNNTIASAGGTAITALDANEKNIRYLCENAEKAFTWRLTPNILAAGASTKYSLRLVNHVKVNKESANIMKSTY